MNKMTHLQIMGTLVAFIFLILSAALAHEWMAPQKNPAVPNPQKKIIS